jgi:UDP-2,4-diacetamido-2,4,6-trideoxy-beta-L-altropyranose hydrolase
MRALGVIADHGGVGVGHLGRCLAAIQEWVARGGIARFHTEAPLPEHWEQRLRQGGASVAALDAIEDVETDAWLLDGYRFDPNLQSRLRRLGALAVVDDHGTVGRYDADVIIDPNLGTSSQHYRSASGARLLLGPEYALLRTEVVDARPSQPIDRTVGPQRLLVSLGGEPGSAVRALVEPVIREARGWGMSIDRLEGVSDVSKPLATADLALAAAGGTCWELCAFGIPAVVVAVVANQRPSARGLGEMGAAMDAGDIETATSDDLAAALRSLHDDPVTRRRQARVGRALVDGLGARRVVSALLERVSTR